MSRALVIGGTGTLGKRFVPMLLEMGDFQRVRILSRNEHAQMEMERFVDSDRLDFLMGDVRDSYRVMDATRDCESVFHFAATKSVDKVEYNPYEAVLTNIIGTQNVINACRRNGVSRAVFTSSDKASAPLNFYGGTKLCAEKLWIAGNVGSWACKFAAVRYGNVFGSRGSVIEKWAAGAPFLLTHPDMTRFFMSIDKAAHLVLEAWRSMKGGEVFLPKMKSISMGRLLDWVNPQAGRQDVQSIGIRPGEKMHEELFTKEERRQISDCGAYFIKYPSHKNFPIYHRGRGIGEGEAYTSETAEPLTEEELTKLWESR